MQQGIVELDLIEISIVYEQDGETKWRNKTWGGYSLNWLLYLYKVQPLIETLS